MQTNEKEMMGKGTALEQAIELVGALDTFDEWSENLKTTVQSILKSRLPVEKEQIQRAFNIGMTDADIMSSEEYYNSITTQTKTK